MKSKKRNILICDDDLLIVNVVSLSLELAGYTVSRASDGAEALAIIKPKPKFHDIAIIDHVMPNLDGLGLVKELRKCNFAGKIIVLSGYLDDRIQEEYKQLSVEKIMAKPYKMSDLLNNVAELLSN